MSSLAHFIMFCSSLSNREDIIVIFIIMHSILSLQGCLMVAKGSLKIPIYILSRIVVTCTSYERGFRDLDLIVQAVSLYHLSWLSLVDLISISLLLSPCSHTRPHDNVMEGVASFVLYSATPYFSLYDKTAKCWCKASWVPILESGGLTHVTRNDSRSG